ncbi:MAG: helix-turn-helix domain containing protein [Bacilli bacterium]|nr:helix-turn-helix domain containing protein [Bacilli bacterium]
MENLKDKIKNQKISIVSLAERFHVSRPTIYSWIESYENLNFSLLPEDVCKFFDSFYATSCMNDDVSILDIIDDVSLKSYGPNDFMFGHVLDVCNKHFIKIKNYFSKAKLDSGVSVINYFWLTKIVNYEKWTSTIQFKTNILEVVDWAKNELKKYNSYQIALKMFENFNFLFEGHKKSAHQKEFYIEQIFNMPSLYKNLLPLVQEKYKQLIFYYFSKDNPKIVSYYKKNKNDFLKYLLDKKNFILDNSLNVANFSFIIRKRSIYLEETSIALEHYLDENSYFGEFTKRNYIQIIYHVENLEKIAKNIKKKFLPNGVNVEEFKRRSEKALIDFGETISHEVNTSELNNFLLNKEIPIPQKFSSITLVEKNGSLIDAVSSYKAQSVFSMFTNVVGMKVDDYYTEERIDFYNITISIDSYCIDFIFKNNLVNDFASYLSSCSETIIKKLKISDNSLTDEVVGTVNLILNSIYIKDKKFQQAYYYSIALNVISLIEKILRYVYQMNIKKDTISSASILVYLNIRDKKDFDKTMKNFDYDLYKFIGYYLCRNDNDVGKDLRNKFMHRENGAYNLASYTLILELYSLLLHLLTFVTRTVLITTKEGENNEKR